MLVAERGIRFIKLVAVCIFIFVQCNILVKKVSKPVVLLTILFNCAADTIRYDKLIVYSPFTFLPAALLCFFITIALIMKKTPKAAQRPDHNCRSAYPPVIKPKNAPKR